MISCINKNLVPGQQHRMWHKEKPCQSSTQKAISLLIYSVFPPKCAWIWSQGHQCTSKVIPMSWLWIQKTIAETNLTYIRAVSSFAIIHFLWLLETTVTWIFDSHQVQKNLTPFSPAHLPVWISFKSLLHPFHTIIIWGKFAFLPSPFLEQGRTLLSSCLRQSLPQKPQIKPKPVELNTFHCLCSGKDVLEPPQQMGICTDFEPFHDTQQMLTASTS